MSVVEKLQMKRLVEKAVGEMAVVEKTVGKVISVTVGEMTIVKNFRQNWKNWKK